MPIRLVAVDLDGTLLNSQSEISAANSRALERVSALGTEVVIVTGRRHASARPIVQRLSVPATLISSNGAMIASASGEILRRDFLPRASAREMLRAGRAYRPYAVAIFEREARGQVVMQEGASPEGPLSWYLAKYREALELVTELEEALPTDPVQVMFGGPPALLAPLEGLLRASPAAAGVHLTWTKYFSRNMSLLDVMHRGCTKAAALAWFARRQGIAREDVMAIGDNLNDAEMLEFAGRPVVMGNATPGLARDGWETTGTNDEDGVAQALARAL